MQTTINKKDLANLYAKGKQEPDWFWSKVLDVDPDHIWDKMRDIGYSVRDNEKTVVPAGHGVSKTFSAARIALQFLYCHCPSTVITTAPSGTQVEDLLWREIHAAHAGAKIRLGGKMTTVQLDLQEETGRKWFATGFSTRADTVTAEATKMQGYHNEHLLLIFDEAAGILPEIWRAGEHIGAPFKRWLAVGNATSGTGEFPEAINSGLWNVIQVSVTDTPNFIQGKTVIPGVYGVEYEREIRTKYGIDSDEYNVRIKGGVSRKRALGSYYGVIIDKLKQSGRIGIVEHNPHYSTHIVLDTGYTTAIWFFQSIGTDIHFIRYYEDSGVGIDGYARLFDEFRVKYGYHYAGIYVPCDMDSNATRIITGQTTLETLRNLNYMATPLPKEHKVIEGIYRTSKFLTRCRFDKENCGIGIDRLSSYHERVNKRLSTDTNPVFTGEPEKDGNDHPADAMRYASMTCEKGFLKSQANSGLSLEKIKQLQESHGYN
jgi:hypothetical protein